MATLKSRFYEFFPDGRQVLNFRAEQVNTLTACNLGIEIVFSRNDSQHDQLLRSDFSARHPRNNGVSSISLDIGHETIITILQRLMFWLQDILVPQPGKNRGHSRLADLASLATISTVLQDFSKGRESTGLDDRKQFCARVAEMLAQMIIDHFSSGLHSRLENVRDEPHTSATARPSSCAGFHCRNRLKIMFVNRVADGGFGYVVARTYLCRVGHRVHTAQGRCTL